MIELKDEFLSEEDLDLANLSNEELDTWWNLWLEQAQATNDDDADSYSHGVFVLMREPRETIEQKGNG
ncbi:MAG: hypothetical protein JXA71_13285 [Chitinispirillaceae bacterium]|nr:hypothetical protein [Chitinispirillaceae bacterium]